MIDTETMWYNIFSEVLDRDYGFQFPIEEYVKCVGISDQIVYDFVQQELGDKIEMDIFRRKIQSQFHEVKEQLELRDGILNLLQCARENGMKIGLATSSLLDWVLPFLNRFNLMEYFDVIKTRDHVKNIKPDPELYIKTLEELRVEPHEAVAIEDSLNGSNAAITAGMDCIVIPNHVTAHLDFHPKCKVYQRIPVKLEGIACLSLPE